jgi:1,2-diacylglycerol 3-beta-glucosyltransferase
MAAAYFFLAAGLGIRQFRRLGVPLGHQAELDYGHPFAASAGAPEADIEAWYLYFLIPCLNEEAVIGSSVTGLVDPQGAARIVVVDDASDDDTTTVAEAAGGRLVTVVRRELPDARKGKGGALNAGFRHILADVADRGLDADRVIVCVMDADGRLCDGAIHAVLPLFDDETAGGAQLAVRIRNRKDNFILQFQDHQFWTLSSLTQAGRIGTKTVSLGGNGQFTRLSALLEVGDQPWSTSLTEDLDLAISMALAGWALTSTPRAAVDQQGVAQLRPLVRQRTRWYQGHMMSGRRLPEVFRSTRLSHASSVEMILYLLVPWLFDLPWSILYHLVTDQPLRSIAEKLFVSRETIKSHQSALPKTRRSWPNGSCRQSVRVGAHLAGSSRDRVCLPIPDIHLSFLDNSFTPRSVPVKTAERKTR